MDQEYLDAHRAKTGIEGSWKSYFTLLKQALDTKSLTLIAAPGKKKTQKFEMQNPDFVLKVHYPLMVGARITGTFTLSDFEVTGRVRHETLQTLLFKTTQLLAEERARPVQ